ncbi:MAG: cob(I)yrinic acid a,c-diamide adenosyltransferase [Chlamydiae bacterium]|nr:cob(I)yrinic acid a,c-diamide adenosyltransferase [Chlamydiota bacterium]MBI3266550.1 cob(I)yrinic acid a,c-diamide adenosyltransferase [Chlamydiota bacterium]
MKIYTKTGDQGETGLIGGERVWKHDLRIEAYGTVDETNSVIGIAMGLAREAPLSEKGKKELLTFLQKTQNELFCLGCELATPPNNAKKDLPKINSFHITNLEKFIDRLEEELEPLKNFILPGGLPLSGMLHLARCVCRRAERRCVELSQKERLDPLIVQYLNRLSDTLFVLARWSEKKMGGKEIPWKKTVEGRES